MRCRLPEELLRNAEIAMYEAKQRALRLFRLTETMHENAVEVLGLQTNFRRAVERNDFHLDFPPIYALESRLVTGIEALVRWPLPNRGRVAPAVFIPLAEEIGLMGEIGSWVLREACPRMRR